jgi:peroxiredoxin Q/BCP
MTLPAIGANAPDFTLTNHDGKPFSLALALKRSPVVLVFYTMDGSPNCNALLCGVNQDVDLFARHGIQIVGINYAEPDRHGRYAKSKFLRLPLLSDNQFNVARAYDSLFRIGPIRVIRYSVVGIDQKGIIRYHVRGRPDNEAILAGMQDMGT